MTEQFFTLVLIQYVLHQVLYNFDSLRTLHNLQKRLFRLIPHVSLYHGQYAFFNIAVQNARCRRLPNVLLDMACNANDVCCGRIISQFLIKYQFSLNFLILYINKKSIIYFIFCFSGLKCADGECKNQKPYFKDFRDDMNFEECILYLSITPILYFTLLIMMEEKLFLKLFRRVINRGLKNEQEVMDEEVKKEKLAVALEINRVNSQGKSTLLSG